MIPIVISVLKVFFMIVPAIIGIRLLILGYAKLDEWTGHRFDRRDLKLLTWFIRLLGLILIGVSVAVGWSLFA